MTTKKRQKIIQGIIVDFTPAKQINGKQGWDFQIPHLGPGWCAGTYKEAVQAATEWIQEQTARQKK